ncbi:MAG: hypothetical protein M1818_005644 [Claussenomyces sp. TS43310]|nr:MAG: hypothetical protein M1818_005644 [Claussenomyces sp. TS43310]
MLSQTGRHASLLLILSYVFDWVVIIVGAVVGAVLGNITPNKRPINVYDPDISFPYVAHEKVSLTTAVIVSVVAPAVIILLIAFFLVPGPTVDRETPKALIWRRKVWEWFVGWTGLGLSSAAAFLITSGVKNLIGKPRPQTLSVCQPDIENLTRYVVGGFGNAVLVSASVCQNSDKSTLDDTFRSFPSGHSSTAAAGLVYLSLFLASKLAITVPFLSPRQYSRSTTIFSAFPSRNQSHGTPSGSQQYRDGSAHPKNNSATSGLDPYAGPSGHDEVQVAARNQSAAPPIYLLAIAFVPIGVAIYIASTRFSDFKHHGFDILSGLFLGTVTAIFSFRFYHLPISQGAGWAWGPRSRKRAFWTGIGVGTYASVADDDEAHSGSDAVDRDIEANGLEAGPSGISNGIELSNGSTAI